MSTSYRVNNQENEVGIFFEIGGPDDPDVINDGPYTKNVINVIYDVRTVLLPKKMYLYFCPKPHCTYVGHVCMHYSFVGASTCFIFLTVIPSLMTS